MTDMLVSETPKDQAQHALSPLTALEIDQARSILEAAGEFSPQHRMSYLGLVDPDMRLIHKPGYVFDRRIRVMTFTYRSAGDMGKDIVVSLTQNKILSVDPVDPFTQGHVPITLDETDDIADILNASDEWKAALAKRGLDPEKVVSVPFSAGNFADYGGDNSGRRMFRTLSWLPSGEEGHIWAKPIDGLSAHVDGVERKVVSVMDLGVLPLPDATGDFYTAEATGPLRETLRPIQITQPEGPSFSLNGGLLEWEGWSMRLAYDQREGLVLYEISFQDRSIITRASIAEMVVPYCDPSPVRNWVNYFDTGEMMLGTYANSLVNGCDCLGEITYIDAVVANPNGEARSIPNAICLHEEDAGVLWKHYDGFTKSNEVRRNRKLVVSFFVTLGNYDYGFYWYFTLDGAISMEVKATGVVITNSYPGFAGKENVYSSEVAPGLGAPFHQHMFSARLHMALDGNQNTVVEKEVKRVPMGPGNELGNAFTFLETPLKTEEEGQRVADPLKGRTWNVINPNKLNAVGKPVSYSLHPENCVLLAADDGSSISKRAAFAKKHLWVTPYEPSEMYPSGDIVNQSPGTPGLPEFTAGNRNIENTDIVLWHTFGLTHMPRPEDYPIMPVDRVGFMLKPSGFFDSNPTMNVPPSPRHCAPDAGQGSHCSRKD